MPVVAVALALAGVLVAAGEEPNPVEKRVLGKSGEASYAGKVVVIKIGEKDLMNTQSFKFWRRVLRRATQEEARAVVFDLDTPGGLAMETKEIIMNDMRKLSIASFAYVNDEAMSAGALISVATDAIYMAPASTIGAAGIISALGGEMDPVLRAKLESGFDAYMRTVVKEKGHNMEVVRAMMVRKDEERKFGEVVVGEGELLTLTADEAVQVVDGRPLLARGVVASIGELLEKEGLSDVELVRAEPTGFERIAWYVGILSPILILIGVGAAYVEMKAPGFGVAGAISLAAFGVFFFGNYVAGNLAGYELAGVFLLGVILILVEIFLIPGTGVAGFAGAALVFGTLLFAMVDRLDYEDFGEGGFSVVEVKDLLRTPALILSIGIIGSVLLVISLMRFFASIPLFGWLTLQKELPGGASLEGEDEVIRERVGWTGVTLTDLHPAGKARFREETLDVVADGAFIAKGARVRITEEEGMRLVVTEA